MLDFSLKLTMPMVFPIPIADVKNDADCLSIPPSCTI